MIRIAARATLTCWASVTRARNRCSRRFEKSLAQAADDGVEFDVDALRVDRIREELEYGGLRLRTIACLSGARISLTIDIGEGHDYARSCVGTPSAGPASARRWSRVWTVAPCSDAVARCSASPARSLSMC